MAFLQILTLQQIRVAVRTSLCITVVLKILTNPYNRKSIGDLDGETEHGNLWGGGASLYTQGLVPQ